MSDLLPRTLAAALVLVRHGESTFIAEGRFQGRRDAPLSALGERQARLAGERLAQRDVGAALPIPAGPPLAIWHSPLSRARQTAQAIAAAQPSRVKLLPIEGLTEIAQGAWEGLPSSEVRAKWPAELAAWRQSPAISHAPGGEALIDAAARVRGAVAQIVRSISEASAAMPPDDDESATLRRLERTPVPGYPNAGPLAADLEPWAVLVAHDGIFRLLTMTLLDVSIERFWSFPFNLCAISVISLNDSIATLRAHNLSEHLSPLADEARAAAEARGDRRGAL